MLEELFNRLFGIDDGSQAQKEAETFREDIGDGFYLTYEEAFNGYGGYCDVNLCLCSETNPSLHHQITDKRGNFLHFPGYLHGEWEKELDTAFKPRVRFPCSIGPFKNGKAVFMWQVQPDGRYFQDEDGFGAENCEEIWLRSYIDERGNFTEPFTYIRSK